MWLVRPWGGTQPQLPGLQARVTPSTTAVCVAWNQPGRAVQRHQPAAPSGAWWGMSHRNWKLALRPSSMALWNCCHSGRWHISVAYTKGFFLQYRLYLGKAQVCGSAAGGRGVLMKNEIEAGASHSETLPVWTPVTWVPPTVPPRSSWAPLPIANHVSVCSSQHTALPYFSISGPIAFLSILPKLHFSPLLSPAQKVLLGHWNGLNSVPTPKGMLIS